MQRSLQRIKGRRKEIACERSTPAAAFAFVSSVVVKTPVHALAGVLVALFVLAGLSARLPATASTSDAVVVVTSEQAKSLDPHVTTSASDFRILSQMYEGLVTHAPGTLKLAPSLAERWEVSGDAKSLTFFLRKDARFSDGSAFNADAVRFNFERMLRPDHPYHHTGPFPLAFLFEKIARVEVEAPYRVRLHLSEPFAPLLSNLAYPSGYMVSPTAVRKHGKSFGKHGGGTGPFTASEWNKSRSILLERAGQHWAGKSGASKIVFRLIADPMTALTELYSGGADILLEVPTDAATRLRLDPAFSLIETQGAHLWFVILNLRTPQLRDVRVRRALNHAINRDHLVRHVLQDTATPAASVIADGFGDHRNPGVRPYAFDPARARKLLAEAGVALPMTLKLLVPTGGSGMLEPELMATAMQADLRKVGVNVEITTMEWNAYLATVNAGLSSDVHMAAMAWMTNDPDTLPALTLRSAAHPPKGFNSGWYANPEVDTLVDQARASAKPAARAEKYRQLDALVFQDAPWIFVASYKQNAAVRKRVSGVRLSRSFLLNLHEATVR